MKYQMLYNKFNLVKENLALGRMDHEFCKWNTMG